MRSPADAGTLCYGWLGGKQRAADTPTGVILMGVRLYNATTARFLTVDPVTGGSCNAYDYACADPINGFELDGKRCAKWLRWACRAASAFACGWTCRHQSWIAGKAAQGYARLGGGSCSMRYGLRTCSGTTPWMYPRAGITIGDTYITGRKRSAISRGRIAHESVHRSQWRKWGFSFIGLYAASGSNPCKNRYERQAGVRRGGYRC
ncbi:RHS repeat-associated core domain-containing protein [Asanoa sp. NPDC049518]|uniref:RHS repeat-associated core domain-containing protein n=1 Tax=unclassified Asanoa TaxID=2685164 RepID=UPI003431AD62